MRRGFTRRGQPLVALVLVLGSWVSARAMMWDASALSPAGLAADRSGGEAPMPPPAAIDAVHPVSAARARSIALRPIAPRHVPLAPGLASGAARCGMAGPARLAPDLRPPDRAGMREPRQLPAPPSAAPSSPVPARIAGGYRSVETAVLSPVAALAGLAASQPQAAVPASLHPAGHEPRAVQRRWSADAWVLWRRGGPAILSGGILGPSYGASQAGTVLRYRLAPGSGHRVAVYFRATSALGGTNEREAALGLSARPIANIPLVAAGEVRFTRTAAGQMVRPAGFVVTEFPPLALPLGMRAEAYGQAGYVGGQFATPFADGQLRIDRGFLRWGGAELRLGGGVWGGAQKGASRLDAGPSLILARAFGGTAAMRLGADWRFRVAGHAAPESGPAITLSAGF